MFDIWRSTQGKFSLRGNPSIPEADGAEEILPQSRSPTSRTRLNYRNGNRREHSFCSFPWGKNCLKIEILAPYSSPLNVEEAGQEPFEELIGRGKEPVNLLKQRSPAFYDLGNLCDSS